MDAGRYLSQFIQDAPNTMNKTSYGKPLTSNTYYIDKLQKNAMGYNTNLDQTFMRKREDISNIDLRRHSNPSATVNPKVRLNMAKYGSSRIHNAYNFKTIDGNSDKK